MEIPAVNQAIRESLLDWYSRRQRKLPFRARRDAYGIWISEVMAQQTTMAAVIPYWQRFLARFPDLESLAAATMDQVLASWSGLGYYRRARHLHEAAKIMAEQHEGEFPRTLGEIRALPGVGAYTAAAVASIAFGLPEAAIDGNATRVITRLFAIPGDPRKAAARHRIEKIAKGLIDPERPGDFNQALMELGALVCKPRNAQCGTCPTAGFCEARSTGEVDRFPETPSNKTSVSVVIACLRILDDQGFPFLRQVPEGQVNAGLWELPSATLHHGKHDHPSPAPRQFSPRLARQLEEHVLRTDGLRVRIEERLATLRHTITHHRITAHLCHAELEADSTPDSGLRSYSTSELDRLALTGLTRKARRYFSSGGSS